MSGPDLSLMTRQLSALLGAGVQLVDALGILSEQSSKAQVKRMMSQVRERVRENLARWRMRSRLIARFSRQLYVGMIRAGEQAAALEAVKCWIVWPTISRANRNSSPRFAAP